MFDLASEILQTMRHNKLRTALTGLSVAWGIFMLITLVAVATGVTRDFEEDMMTADNQKMQMWGGTTTKPYRGYRDGRSISLKNSDISLLEDDNTGDVRAVTSEISGGSARVSTNTTFVDAGYTGVFPSAFEQENLTMLSGRFLSEADQNEKRKVMAIPEEYAKQLFPPDGSQAVGSRVNCAGLSFTIVGVYRGQWVRTFFIPYSTALMLASDKEKVGQVTVLLDGISSSDDAEAVEKALRKKLAAAHDFDPEDKSAVWIWNSLAQMLTVKSGLGILNVGVWVLGLLTLLSGIIGISNIMFVSVKERTHEIGIRRAIGAKPSKILTQILAESVAITTLFGYIGIIMGLVLTELLSMIFAQFMENAKVDIGITLQVTAVLIIAGALAGLFPALKALKVKPVEALRDE